VYDSSGKVLKKGYRLFLGKARKNVKGSSVVYNAKSKLIERLFSTFAGAK
jgi:hypothetical protein